MTCPPRKGLAANLHTLGEQHYFHHSNDVMVLLVVCLGKKVGRHEMKWYWERLRRAKISFPNFSLDQLLSTENFVCGNFTILLFPTDSLSSPGLPTLLAGHVLWQGDVQNVTTLADKADGNGESHFSLCKPIFSATSHVFWKCRTQKLSQTHLLHWAFN